MKQSPLPVSKILVCALAIALGAGHPAAAAAQAVEGAPARPQGAPQQPDSVAFDRARQLVLGGHAVAGRALADSLVQSIEPGTPAYGEALYWRASISATAADAERDYRRIIIEYPLAPHAGDALLALAQLEMSRGDRTAAVSHLQRFMLEYPRRPDRPRAGLWLGRLLIEGGDAPKGCAVLAEARVGVADTRAELRNQIDYYAGRCVGVTSAVASTAGPTGGSAPASPAPAASSTEPAAPAPPARADDRDSTRERLRDSAVAPAGPWTVQIAAYQTRMEADALVSKLRARGHDAYLTHAARIYRVRIGHFATSEEALALLQSLAASGVRGFVTKSAATTR